MPWISASSIGRRVSPGDADAAGERGLVHGGRELGAVLRIEEQLLADGRTMELRVEPAVGPHDAGDLGGSGTVGFGSTRQELLRDRDAVVVRDEDR